MDRPTRHFDYKSCVGVKLVAHVKQSQGGGLTQPIGYTCNATGVQHHLGLTQGPMRPMSQFNQLSIARNRTTYYTTFMLNHERRSLIGYWILSTNQCLLQTLVVLQCLWGKRKQYRIIVQKVEAHLSAAAEKANIHPVGVALDVSVPRLSHLHRITALIIGPQNANGVPFRQESATSGAETIRGEPTLV